MWRVAIIGACALALSGCGTDGSRTEIAGVVERFQQALADGDGALACAQLTAAARDALESEEELPCRRAIFELDLGAGGRVSGSDVDITSASADVPGRGTAFLDQTPYGWRISAAGCSPTSPGLPYDCELEV